MERSHKVPSSTTSPQALSSSRSLSNSDTDTDKIAIPPSFPPELPIRSPAFLQNQDFARTSYMQLIPDQQTLQIYPSTHRCLCELTHAQQQTMESRCMHLETELQTLWDRNLSLEGHVRDLRLGCGMQRERAEWLEGEADMWISRARYLEGQVEISRAREQAAKEKAGESMEHDFGVEGFWLKELVQENRCLWNERKVLQDEVERFKRRVEEMEAQVGETKVVVDGGEGESEERQMPGSLHQDPNGMMLPPVVWSRAMSLVCFLIWFVKLCFSSLPSSL